MENIEKEVIEPKKRKKGPGPVIIPKHISDWARDQSSRPPVNNWKTGGGHDPWNK